jgi:orotidine-5'-phosphate decarboxylase
MHEAAVGANGRAPLLLAVTVLTSMKDVDLKEVGVKGKVKKEVETLAVLAQQSGLDGVVASGQEISLIRGVAGANFLIVTPGVRPAWAAHGDQKRIVTPREALKEGADYLVIGRPITEHKNPLEAADLILREMEN